jgi:hypothetical protein
MTFETLFQSLNEQAAARKEAAHAPNPKPVKMPKPRRADFDTHCVHGHPWNTENVYRPPSGGRKCRACHREGRYYTRRKHAGNHG